MSDELIVIVGNDGPLPRNKITKGFWDYTEEQGLKKKGRIITCDAALKKIWTDKEEIHMYDVQKGLKVHITTMTKDEEHKWRLKNPTKFNDHYDTNKTQTKNKIHKVHNIKSINQNQNQIKLLYQYHQ
jgi:chromatin remodeling complex protein RSC6